MLLNFKFDASLFIVLHGVFSGKEIMYGSTPLLSQKESLPNFIDHGLRYPTPGASAKKINCALQSVEPFLQA